MSRVLKGSMWVAIAVLGAAALGGIALNRGEHIDAWWFVAAAVCVYLVATRFYAGWIAARVLTQEHLIYPRVVERLIS